jgi:S1-C subfamily serine protease
MNADVGTFYGPNAPPVYLTATNKAPRHARRGDRWINTNNLVNYIYTDKWNIIYLQNLNINASVYSENIYKVVSISCLFGFFDIEQVGTGFFISSNGLILTVAHIIYKNTYASKVWVTIYPENITIQCKILGYDLTADLAILYMNLKDSPVPIKERNYFKLSDSRNLKIGETIFLLGDPQGFIQSITIGIVQNNNYVNLKTIYVSSDVENAGGNSGSPVINIKGEVIGILSIGVIFSDNIIGLETSLAVNTFFIQPIIDYFLQMVDYQNFPLIPLQYPGGFFGINGKYYDDIDFLTVPGPTSINGYLLDSVYVGSPVDMIGLTSGDIIISAALNNNPLMTVALDKLVLDYFIFHAGVTGIIDIKYLKSSENYLIEHTQTGINLSAIPIDNFDVDPLFKKYI